MIVAEQVTLTEPVQGASSFTCMARPSLKPKMILALLTLAAVTEGRLGKPLGRGADDQVGLDDPTEGTLLTGPKACCRSPPP